jgi:hypothetical protein
MREDQLHSTVVTRAHAFTQSNLFQYILLKSHTHSSQIRADLASVVPEHQIHIPREMGSGECKNCSGFFPHA